MRIEIKSIQFCKKDRKVFPPDASIFSHMINHEKCPACSSTQIFQALRSGDNEKYISLAFCNNCLHYFYSHIPDPNAISVFYQKNWNSSGPTAPEKKPKPTYKFANLFSQAKIPAGAAILDLGCGLGRMIQGLTEKGFKNLTGYEISESRYQVSKESNPTSRIVCGGFEDLDHDKYDIIFSNHVLEHIAYPAKFVKQVESSLKDDGLVFLSVPNSVYEALFYKAFDFSHLQSFSHESLAAIFGHLDFSYFFIKTEREDELTIVCSKSKTKLAEIRKNLEEIVINLPSSKELLKSQWNEFERLFKTSSQGWTIYPPPSRITRTFFGHSPLSPFQLALLKFEKNFDRTSKVSYHFFKLIRKYLLGLPNPDQEVGFVETNVEDNGDNKMLSFHSNGHFFLFSK